MQDKIGVIAQTFGCTSGKIETSPCSGAWRGTSDISIVFDNGASLAVGNERTPQAKTAKVLGEYVNYTLALYNPEIVAAKKEAALAALRKQEAEDNLIAAQKGLKPYTVLTVELCDGVDDNNSGHIGSYYVTLAVDGKIRAHLDSGLASQIANGSVSEAPRRDHYYTAGALKEASVDYVFHNVGFSSFSTLYTLPISEAVLDRAKKVLAEHSETQAQKSSIKAQLTARPIPGTPPSERPRNTGAR